MALADHEEASLYDVELVEDNEDDTMLGQLVAEETISNDPRNVRKRAVRCGAKGGIAPAAVISTAILAVAIVVLTKLWPLRRTSSSNPSLYSLEYLQASPLAQVLPKSTLEQVLLDASPQSYAFAWVEKHPDLGTMPDWRKRQLMALSTIYYATGGETIWRYGLESDGGSTSTTTCPGVEVFWQNYEVNECYWSQRNHCLADGKYSELVIGYVCGLMGTIPPEISFLTALTSLQIKSHHNDEVVVGGSLPTEFALLTSLEELDLLESQAIGPGADELGKLSALERLSYHPSGPLPTELGLLTNLEELHVSHIQSKRLAGTVPSEIGLLRQLSHLQANSLFLEGTIPTEMMNSNMTGLQSLYLSRNVLTGPIPKALAMMTALEEVFLDHNLLTGTIALDVCNSSSLHTLAVDCDEVACSCCKCGEG